MGAGGVPSGGVAIYRDLRKLDDEGNPNSRADLYQNGRLKQSRWYGPDGRAVRNRDYFHGGNMEFPHDHEWDWEKDPARQKDHLKPDYNNFR